MSEFEKAELLRDKLGVSFEEARNALRRHDGDLLDAMIYLEKKADDKKYGTPEFKACSGADVKTDASAETHREIPRVDPVIRNTVPEGPSFFQWLGHALGTLVKKSLENYLVVSHNGVVKFRVSIFVLAILFMVFHGTLLVAMGVSLFFGVKYSFAGKDDLSRVNVVMDRAGTTASQWWGSYSANPEVSDLCRKYDEDEHKDNK